MIIFNFSRIIRRFNSLHLRLTRALVHLEQSINPLIATFKLMTVLEQSNMHCVDTLYSSMIICSEFLEFLKCFTGNQMHI